MLDFRKQVYKDTNVVDCGKYISKKAYWKLYAIENIFRVVVNSILSLQIPSDEPDNWWDLFVDGEIKKKVLRYKKPYVERSWHSKPGGHDIYYIDLKDLNKIIVDNRPLFEPIFPRLDKWIIMIEDVNIPRNLIAHMNLPSEIDMKRIDVLYSDCLILIKTIGEKIELKIP